MNYLRGAVSAISAPYHYYNQINPSTLTGAIDVIVVKRPAKDGGTELACSPFHVRFGKWQVLRPSDKRVKVFVNGNPIPYDMKIGDAGEAFFVFETDDDVPEDLITSPLLQPTRTEGESTPAAADDDEQHRVAAPGAPDHKREGVRPRATSEPDFFDLDALPQGETPKLSDRVPVYAQGGLDNIHNDRSATMDEQDRRADEVLYQKRRHRSVAAPDIEYRKDIALDIEGYHASTSSEQTPRKDGFTFPSLADQTTYDSEQEAPPHSATPSVLSSNSSDSGDLTRGNSFKLQPSFRATSEPLPDVVLTSADESPHIPPDNMIESSLTSPGPSSLAPTPPPLGLHGMQRGPQEYSWEWGGFPTPSPMKMVFPSAKVKGKQGTDGYFGVTKEEGDEADNEDDASDPSDGKPWKRGRKRSQGKHKLDIDIALVASVARSFKRHETDPTQFVLDVDDVDMSFELSLVDLYDISSAGQSSFHTLHKTQTARIFDRSKVTFQSFLDDGTIIGDERLIMRWAGCRYIVCCDDVQVMEALVNWRIAALDEGQDDDVNSSLRVSRSEEPRQLHARSKSSPPEDFRSGSEINEVDIDRVTTRASKLSWVPWWSAGRKNGAKMVGNDGRDDRPQLRGSVTAPAVASLHPHEILKPLEPELQPRDDSPSMRQRPEPTYKRKRYAKTLRLTSDQLKVLDLKSGANVITFSLSASGTTACTARIFFWEHTDQVVISDIDGTITKSDGLGHVFAMIGRDWTHVGVAKLYSDITRNGYKILYLTSRAIGQADATRYYLKGIKQNDYQLPEGPVIMSPDRLMASLHREVIMRKPEVFKMACLRDIRNLFGEANRSSFYAGFGNRITDALSYRSVNVPSSRIFTIDSSGDVRMELLELAGYKSSYIHMADLVDQMFPPINKKWSPDYTDFNYWRTPVLDIPLPDLTPPSPALSARSDASSRSALARLRNFSLVGSNKQLEEASSGDLRRNVHARLSSLERLSSSFVDGIRRSMSPDSRSESSVTYAGSDADSDGEWEVDADGKRRRRLQRRQSVGSMPGTLDDMHFFGLDEYEERQFEEPVFGEFEDGRNGRQENDQYQEGEPYEEDIIADEQALEEDLFAAGEMQKVPFL